MRGSDLSTTEAPTLAEILRTAEQAELDVHTGAPTPESFFDALPLQALRDEGVDIDRRSFAARPPWLGDRAVTDSIARRSRGRADVLTMWLRDPGRAAARCGLGSAGHRQAIRDLDGEVRRAVQMLRRDEAPPQIAVI